MNQNSTMTFSIDQERLEYHLKNKRRKIIRLLICMIVWAIILLYMITPLSTYKMMHVKGNVYLTEDEILDLADIKSKWWWIVDSEKLKEKLEKHPNISNVSVSKGFEGLNISILERYPLAIKDGNYVMNNAEVIGKEDYDLNIENLIDITTLSRDATTTFVNQYIHVDLNVRNVFYRAEMQDEKIMILYGNFDENSHFKIYLNLDYLSIKLSNNNFINIKSEMLGKVNSDNVQYKQGNPCIIEYNFKNVYEFKVG